MNQAPAHVVPPGDFIREELEERGWKQEDLARILDRPLPTVNQIITGKKSITAETAHELAEAFGTSAELWMRLESAYRLARANQPQGKVRDRARLYEVAPLREMARRRWINKPTDEANLERELKRFFRVDSLEKIPKLPFAARSSARDSEDVHAAQTAWCLRALQLASTVRVARFSNRAFEEGLSALRALARSAEGVRDVPRVLAKMGIRFVVVEHLQGTRIDGAALWLDSKCSTSPVVALSMRHRRIDCFWHTLFHELSHIRHRDSLVVDIALVGEDRIVDHSEIEDRADREAADSLIPASELENFIVRVQPFFSKDRIRGFAGRIGVHPGIVVGQLQFRDAIGYHANREMLVDVRDLIVESSLTDGWGYSLEIELAGGSDE